MYALVQGLCGLLPTACTSGTLAFVTQYILVIFIKYNVIFHTVYLSALCIIQAPAAHALSKLYRQSMTLCYMDVK